MSKSEAIRKTGEYTGRTDEHKRTVHKVRCQGCGNYIYSDGDLADVEHVRTKRGTDLFFHTDCMDDVWKRRIC